jgi:hypothetical protein
MDQLGLVADVDPANSPQPHLNLKLHQLEDALANMTAALYWSGKHCYERHDAHMKILRP